MSLANWSFIESHLLACVPCVRLSAIKQNGTILLPREHLNIPSVQYFQSESRWIQSGGFTESFIDWSLNSRLGVNIILEIAFFPYRPFWNLHWYSMRLVKRCSIDHHDHRCYKGIVFYFHSTATWKYICFCLTCQHFYFIYTVQLLYIHSLWSRTCYTASVSKFISLTNNSYWVVLASMWWEQFGQQHLHEERTQRMYESGSSDMRAEGGYQERASNLINSWSGTEPQMNVETQIRIGPQFSIACRPEWIGDMVDCVSLYPACVGRCW